MLAASLAVSLTACGGKKTSQDNAASTVNKEVTAEEYAGTITSNLKSEQYRTAMKKRAVIITVKIWEFKIRIKHTGRRW